MSRVGVVDVVYEPETRQEAPDKETTGRERELHLESWCSCVRVKQRVDVCAQSKLRGRGTDGKTGGGED